ncbi:MAG: glycoside hydrolase family 9 protein [Bacteroidota bacterium]
MRIKSYAFLMLITLVLTACGASLPEVAEHETDTIRLNQIGYAPGTSTQFNLIKRPGDQTALLVDAAGKEVISEFTIADSLEWELAGQTVWPIAVTLPEEAGRYRLYVPEVGYSYAFVVEPGWLDNAFLASMKSLYFQRASTELPEKFAGPWQRAAGHPDTAVYYHPSTGHTGGQLSSPGGWYDAGDFGKYVVNGAFSVGQLLALAEDLTDPIPDVQLNIPESGNGKSDFLDEIKYELDWLITMQDSDGGLFHKLTTKQFDGMVMPAAGVGDRYAIGKGTAATLNFAAATAQASRVYATHDADYAMNLLNLAKLAWSWAERYPQVAFTNPFDISTGEYGDDNFSQEFYWAAAELYLATKEDRFRTYLLQHPPNIQFRAGETWNSFMEMMGVMSILRYPDVVPATLYNPLKYATLQLADSLTLVSTVNPYGQALTDFHWGSNSDVLDAAMIVAAAYQIEAKPAYLKMVTQATDYILGNNALGVSFMTGFGTVSPLHIHHRQSAADGIDAPIPGFVSGGPNSRLQDKADVDYPPQMAPMACWVDQEASYASNEICLNWNAPLTYIFGWLAAQ